MKRIIMMIMILVTMVTTFNIDSQAMEIEGVWPNSYGECKIFKYQDEYIDKDGVIRIEYKFAYLPIELADAFEGAVTEERYIINGGGNTYDYIHYLYKKYDLNNLMAKYGCN